VFGSARRENVARHVRTPTALSRAHFRSAPFSGLKTRVGSFNENGERHLAPRGEVTAVWSETRKLMMIRPSAQGAVFFGRCVQK